jgi:hypothetical protein
MSIIMDIIRDMDYKNVHKKVGLSMRASHPLPLPVKRALAKLGRRPAAGR